MHRHKRLLQRYLIQSQPQPPSLNYVTAYVKLQIDPNTNTSHFQTLSQCVSSVNQRLSQNIQKLQNGEYDHLRPKFHAPPCSTLSLDFSYDTLWENVQKKYTNDDDFSQILYDEYFGNREVGTGSLELDCKWPVEYKFLGSRTRSLEFHVSLLPLLRFENGEDASHFLNKIKRSILTFSGPLHVLLGEDLKVLAKQDFSKFFLVVAIDETHPRNSILCKVKDTINSLRSDVDRAHVTGEWEDGIIDWRNSLLHTSIGVCNSHEEKPLFGPRELFFLNEVLLQNAKLHSKETAQIEVSGSLVLVVNGQHIVY